MLGCTTARVRLPSLSKPREYCSTIAVPGDRVTSATRDARDKRRPMHTVSLRVAGDVRFPCLHAAANTPVQQLGVFFAHLTRHFSLPRYGRRVGLHIVLFEDCSAFTRVAACTLGLSPIC